MSAIIAALTGFFSSSKAQDLAISALKKVGSLDEMDSQAKADYIITFLNATRHQSVTRRFIALLMVVLFASLCLLWALSASIGYYFGVTVSLELAGAVKHFLESVVMTPFNLILSFYFVVNIAQKVGR